MTDRRAEAASRAFGAPSTAIDAASDEPAYGPPKFNQESAPELVGADWLQQTVRITRGAVYFGEHKLPGIIADDGITLKPGGKGDINRLTIEFLVGPVSTDDPLADDA